MTSCEPSFPPHRVSDADRERALDVLRESVAQGRVSQDTFLRRMELVLGARRPEELRAVLHDLPGREPRRGGLVRAAGRVSEYRRRLRGAWQAGRLPQLLLPAPGPYPMTIGRAPGSILRLNDASVSRCHAQLRGTGDGWRLRDLGSANGTWVNGRRVTGSVPVRPGDQVRFGGVGFLLTAPAS
ncbi:DUF1707 and FHA domain-containing protein [Streptomyces sp. ACA25]|uniref:DUF1707 and FHA domain-containing protein n=1 Tax=Streptomyces sp. ACA25 TaxID=3022596 RepID=UPI002307BB59|nr:DUF1707 and FHA domain-containing protein [Streptomyces sp. ACA25]MDB1089172.1 DUF1707 and FHA domain-containing protein [Streptomyces sp. ACA25]